MDGEYLSSGDEAEDIAHTQTPVKDANTGHEDTERAAENTNTRHEEKEASHEDTQRRHGETQRRHGDIQTRHGDTQTQHGDLKNEPTGTVSIQMESGLSLLEDEEGVRHFPSKQSQVCVCEDPITCLGITHRGHRLYAGTSKGSVSVLNMYKDASGVETVISENHPVMFVHPSADDKLLLIATAERNVHVYDSALAKLISTYRGDMYVRDTSNTLGHTHAVYCAQWHPSQKSVFASGSLDGTVRLFDLESKPTGLEQALQSKVILRAVNKRKMAITKECGVHTLKFVDSNCIAAGCDDGSIQIFDARFTGPASRKSKHALRHPQYEEPVHALVAAQNQIYARTSHTLTQWDSRMMKAVTTLEIPSSDLRHPVLGAMDFSSYLLTTDSTASQNGSGDGRGDGKGDGRGDGRGDGGGDGILYIDRREMKIAHRLAVPSRVGVLQVNDAIKQVGYVCEKNVGSVWGLYDEEFSAAEGWKKRDTASELLGGKKGQDEGTVHIESYSVYDLPSNVKHLKDDTFKLVRHRRGELRAKANPPYVEGAGERFMKRSMTEVKMREFLDATQSRDEDPTAWIDKLRSEEETRRQDGDTSVMDTTIIDSAYRQTQPDRLLDYSDLYGGEKKLAGQKKCPQCGLKMCTCGFMTLIAKKPKVN